MDYWVMGSHEKAKQYAASFAALGYDVSRLSFEFDNWVYYSLDGIIHACCNDSLPKIFEDHPRYQMLPLVTPSFTEGQIVVTEGLIGKVEEVEERGGVYTYRVGNNWFLGVDLRNATKADLEHLLK